MEFRPRLLPVLVAASALLFCAKAADVWFAVGTDPLASARAQTQPAATPSAAGQPAAPSKPDGAAAPAKPAGAGKTASRDPSQFSPQEVQLLQSLAQRRNELDKRSSDLDQREALLQAAERRIDDKIVKLGAMQKVIDDAFKKQDQQDDTKLKSLVKIYETMKPKDAAHIFEQLDLPVVLEVLEKMKEQKTAPILASMDPAKAQAVTAALAERHASPELKP
jgi:flagellar motility protein MotE (MotC chaperone)